MGNAVQERIQAKTRDNQLFEVFVNHFEFSNSFQFYPHSVYYYQTYVFGVPGN